MGRNIVRGALLLLLMAPLAVVAQTSAQVVALTRAMDLEGKSQFREAAREYRTALGSEESYNMALLGLERSLHEIGEADTLLAVVDSITRLRPGDPAARTVQLRSLQMLGRSAQLRTAFEAWRAALTRDAAPYREYARILIDAGKMAQADSVLKEAEKSVVNSRVLSLEVAQVRSALGFWDEAVDSWRRAVEDADYLERAAFVGLSRAPAEKRDALRAKLLAPPLNIAVRSVLASLELNWGSAQLAWRALSDLAATEQVTNIWLDFADKAEAVDAWLPARDASLAALGKGGNPEVAWRAARLSVSGGDAQGALDLIARESAQMQLRDAARWFAVVHVRALSSLGRATEAESVALRYTPVADPNVRQLMQHEVAWGWVRGGDVARARRALLEGLDESEVGEIGGWIALYGGDLRTARTQLRGYGDMARFPGTLLAMAVLGRTRKDSSATLGAAFLSLARSDTAKSAQEFRLAAEELPDAASLLLHSSARLMLARDTSASIALWTTIVEKHANAPEAAEADLEWARVLRKQGKRAEAILRLEHLILSQPSSALLPQARRELDAIKNSIPPQAGAGQ